MRGDGSGGGGLRIAAEVARSRSHRRTRRLAGYEDTNDAERLSVESEGYEYAIRLKANSVLQRRIDHLLKRPVGRPPKKPRRLYHSFKPRQLYRAILERIRRFAGTPASAAPA